jgi:hypothetical protein
MPESLANSFLFLEILVGLHALYFPDTVTTALYVYLYFILLLQYSKQLRISLSSSWSMPLNRASNRYQTPV